MDAQEGSTQPHLEGGLKERFYRTFQQEVNALQKQIEQLNTTTWSGDERSKAVDACLAAIDRLSHEVKDASSYIPAYDRRTYGDAVKTLSEKLQNARNEFAPPKKFQFKSARKTNTPITKPTIQSEPQTQESIPSSSNTPSSQPTPQSAPEAAPNTMNISNHTNSYYLPPPSPSLPSTDTSTSGTITNIIHSIIDLSPSTSSQPLAGLILKTISNSLIICGQIAGPLHITGVQNSVLVVTCRQFRMHSSKNVDVYLHCSSRPIIEDCEGIRFAELPDIYTTSEMRDRENQWDQIDDFKWLKFEPSPHFSILAPDERVKDEDWKSIIQKEKDLNEILRMLTVVNTYLDYKDGIYV